MSNKAYQNAEVLLNATATTVGASTTGAVSEVVDLSAEDCLNGFVDITVSAITDSSGGIKFRVQDSSDGGTNWNTVKESAAITATGLKNIRWNVQNTTDQGYTPLRKKMRVVAVTGASDSITVSSVRASRVG
jgi:hypothetical protein